MSRSKGQETKLVDQLRRMVEELRLKVSRLERQMEITRTQASGNTGPTGGNAFLPAANNILTTNTDGEPVSLPVSSSGVPLVSDGTTPGYGQVEEAGLATDSVTNGKIKDMEVTTAKIKDMAISTAKLDDAAVTTDKLEDLQVTSGKLAASAVTTDKIDGGAVVEGKIATAAVTENKIMDTAVTEAKIGNGAVTTGKISDLNVTESKLAAGAVTTSKIGTAAVEPVNLAASAVTGAKIASSTITGSNLASATIATSNLEDQTIEDVTSCFTLWMYDNRAYTAGTTYARLYNNQGNQEGRFYIPSGKTLEVLEYVAGIETAATAGSYSFQAGLYTLPNADSTSGASTNWITPTSTWTFTSTAAEEMSWYHEKWDGSTALLSIAGQNWVRLALRIESGSAGNGSGGMHQMMCVVRLV